MNTVLIEPSEWKDNDKKFELTLSERRAQHIIKILKLSAGDTLKAGKINGLCGKVSVISIHTARSEVTLTIDPSLFFNHPPTPSPVSLVVALPRPKTARRIVRTATELGVKQLHFINSYKVEKSYWQSPLLAPEKLHEQILMGLEQTNDTVLPQVQFHPRFKPFVEDRFNAVIAGKSVLLADPSGSLTMESLELNRKKTLCIVVGPEGGFTQYETEQLRKVGCQTVSLGERILRTETVIPYLCAKATSIQQA